MTLLKQFWSMWWPSRPIVQETFNIDPVSLYSNGQSTKTAINQLEISFVWSHLTTKQVYLRCVFLPLNRKFLQDWSVSILGQIIRSKVKCVDNFIWSALVGWCLTKSKHEFKKLSRTSLTRHWVYTVHQITLYYFVLWKIVFWSGGHM